MSHFNSVRIALALTLAIASPVLAQLPGLPAPAPQEPTQTLARPTEGAERPPVVAPGGAIRGSLFKHAAMTPVAVAADGTQVGPHPANILAVAAPKPKKFQKNDIITVIVAVNSSSATSSQANSQKKQDFDVALQQFVELAKSASGIPALNIADTAKLPEIKFKYDNNRQNQAGQQRSDTYSDRFAAIVVDVKPNGTLVLEATQQVAMDKEVLRYKMSGICNSKDVSPDNTIISSQLANLNLSKQTTGEVREGVRRGWLNTIIDKLSPF